MSRPIFQIVRSANTLASSLAAGGQLVVLTAIVPVADKWPRERSVELHQEALTSRPDRFLRPLTILATVTGLLRLVFDRGDHGQSTAWLVGGIAGSLGVAVVSEKVEFPINRMINEWSLDAIPSDYEETRQRWDKGHAARTALGVASAVCFAVSSIVSSD